MCRATLLYQAETNAPFANRNLTFVVRCIKNELLAILQAWVRRRPIRSTRRAHSRLPAAWWCRTRRLRTWWSCVSSSRPAPISRWPQRHRRTPAATCDTTTCWWGAPSSATCTRASSATKCSRHRTAWRCTPAGRTTARGRFRASCATNRSAPR